MPGHTATLHSAAGCAMNVGQLVPLKANAPDSTEYGATLRAQGSHDAATPDSLRSVGCHRWSLHALRYVASLSLRLSNVSSLAGAIGMRGQSLRHTHPFSCLGRTFHSRLAVCAHATGHCCTDAQGREVFGSLTRLITVTSHRQIQLAPQAARAGKPNVPTPHFATSRIPQSHLTWAHARR